MVNLRSVVVPCAYRTTGRLPVQVDPAPVGTMSAADAVVGSLAPPTVSYFTSYMRTSQTGVPLSASNCWFAARFSSISRLDAVTVDKSPGGLCSKVPRDGVAATPPELSIPFLPPQATSMHAASSEDK